MITYVTLCNNKPFKLHFYSDIILEAMKVNNKHLKIKTQLLTHSPVFLEKFIKYFFLKSSKKSKLKGIFEC